MVLQSVDIFTIAVAIIFVGFFVLIAWKILNDDIPLEGLIGEPDGKASLSRFQLLIFTFVIAGLFLVLSLEKGDFVDIPSGVQVLLGISGGSFVISKAIGTRKETKTTEEIIVKTPDNSAPAAPPVPPAPPAQNG